MANLTGYIGTALGTMGRTAFSALPDLGLPEKLKQVGKLTQQVTPLIEELNDSLDSIGQAFEQGDHSLMGNQGVNITRLLGQILSQEHKENFKNVEADTKWDMYLQPLRNFLTLLENYLHPNISTPPPTIARLQQGLKPAKDLIQGEKDYQQGMIASGISTLFNQTEREFNKMARKYMGASSPEISIHKHPLLTLSELIGTYLQYGDDYLEVSRENKLASSLRHLDQQSSSFKGIESYVYKKIQEGKLHTNLRPLIDFISEFIENEPEIYVHLYKSAVDETYTESEKTNDKQVQVDRAKEYVKTNGSKGIQALWNAGAEFDKLIELRTIASMLGANIKSPTDLSQKIDIALRFFQQDPAKLGIGQHILQAVTQVAAGWLSLFHTWASKDLESSALKNLEDKLDRLKQQINRGNYYAALTELKEELQQSPLSKTMYEGTDSVSPLNMIQEIKEKQVKSFSSKKSLDMSQWDKDMQVEKTRLIDQVSCLATFKTVYNIIGTPSTPVEALEFEKQSDEAYTRIMSAVNETPIQKQQALFVKKLKEEIDKREDIAFFKKATAKFCIWIMMNSVQFFTRHFVSSFIDYLTNTVSLPTRQPLSTTHLNPVERINDCFIAQKQALSRWADDTYGEQFGPLGRKKALEIAMKAPELNGGYAHDELVDRTTKCAINKFLTLEGALSNLIYAANRIIEKWVQTSSGITYGIKYIVSVVPQLVIITGWLVTRGMEKASSMILRFVARRFMLRFNLANTMLDSMKDSLYKQSQYTNAIDEVLLDQLLEVEKLLEEEGGEVIEHEGEEAKILFKEAVANAVRVIDLNRNLTAESLKKAESSRDNALSEATDTVKEFADEQMRNAITQLLIIAYQSILTEEQINQLILKIFRKANDSLRPQTVVQKYYSEEKKAEMTKALGRKPTDEDLKKRFASDHGKTTLEVTDAEIQAKMKIRFNKTEQELRETAFRVIKKSVHRVVQEEGKNALMTASQSVVHYIDFMDRHLFASSGLRTTSLFDKIREAFKNFEIATNATEKQKNLSSLNKTILEFLREYEKKQKLLDKKVTGMNQVTAHVRRINELANKDIIPPLMSFQTALQKFLKEKNPSSLQEARKELEKFYRSVYKHQAELEQIKQEELRLQSNGKTLSEKARIWGSRLIQHGAPVALDQVELYANLRLNQIADGALHLYKDSNTFESFLRHVVMLNFVESLGYRKGIRV